MIKETIVEFVLLKLIESFLKNNNNENKFYYYYTIIYMRSYNIHQLNKYVYEYVDYIIDNFKHIINIIDIIKNGVRCIERNSYLLKYKDISLYDHQKELFTHVKNKHSKLVLYIAPTGTGKTISPIGLSTSNRVIFMCAARHVGLLLLSQQFLLGKNCNCLWMQ